MKEWRILQWVALAALTGLTGGCQTGDALRLRLSDPVYPDHAVQSHAITVERDAHGFPVRYSLHLVAATCFDGQCKPLDVTLHWDAIGRYDGLDVEPDLPLTLKEHEPFTEADYRRLDEVLGNPHSILGNHPLSYFVPAAKHAHGNDGVDGVTGATPTALREAVVPGAAYSSWVLWRWVHGEIVDQLQARTRKRCDDALLMHFLSARDSDFVTFALDELLKRDVLTPAFEEACYRVLEDGGRANCERALRAVCSSPSDPATVQARIIDLYGRNGGSSSPILNYLEELPDATPEIWAQLAAQLSAVTGYSDLDGALELLKQRAAGSPAARQEVEKLARHADPHVAKRARAFLRQDANMQGLPLAGPPQPNAPQRVNIVFLLSDDQPLRAMGHVDPYFHTPNIDKLASQGVVFANGFVESSICCVSRASIMMGQHNVTHGIQSFDDPLSATQIQKSFPVLLRKAGYRTALLGKYGIGMTRAAPKELCLPEKHFDLWYGFSQGPSYWQQEDGKKRYLTSVMEEKAIRFMKETPAEQPFMVYMCLPEPHGQGGGPWNYRDPHFKLPKPNGPPPVVETMTEEAYAKLPEAIRNSKNSKIVGRPAESYTTYMETVRDYTARTDLAVGRIRAALKEIGREDNTVIIFASDNGSMWGAHGIAGKWNMYEESIRVPMMIYDPRLPKSVSGTRSQMALAYDLTATVMDLAGVPAPHMNGKSLMPVIQDPKAEWREDWYYLHDVFSRSKGRPLPNCEGVRGERWKYIRYRKTDPVQEELFDIQADPKEMNNLAGSPEHAEILKRMRARNDELKRELAAVDGDK
ncbi:MAG: sulfatase-like hydrolase/transferase [Verrucomicrobia bacterium]|nr:sulfatase-like hydrolase/transferase [Verrucomicrobiota bacterium]MBT7069163.1 sulfatase-like hydrolase/transferase [Verrucomicrobiota bacterium]